MTKVDAFLALAARHLPLEQVDATTCTHSTSLGTTHTFRATIAPRTRADCQYLVRLARKCNVSLGVISKGQNWGFGSRASTLNVDVLVDLCQMRAILELNEEFAYARIEPGVTQGELSDEIRRRGLALTVDCTGAGRSASILGNVLERGYGFGPLADHSQNIGATEILLPNGTVIETGAHTPSQTIAGEVSRIGLGPGVVDLFVQSNFGIVLSVCVHLQPLSDCCQLFILQLSSQNAMAGAVDRLRKLKLKGVVSAAPHIYSGMRIVRSYLSKAQWPANQGLQELMRDSDISPWTVVIPLAGTEGLVACQEKHLRDMFAGLGKSKCITVDGNASVADDDAARFGVFFGSPSNNGLRQAVWASATQIDDADISSAIDNCGFIWLAHIVPLAHASVECFLNCLAEVLGGLRVEFDIGMNCMHGRFAIATIAVYFEKGNGGEEDRVGEAVRRAVERLYCLGFPPYRLPLNVPAAGYYNPSTFAFLKELKRTLDPRSILNPGRYGL